MIKSFKEYLKEESKGSLSIFDIDDTLFHTTAQIAVMKDGKLLKKLTNQEFNNYKLKTGEEFNFSEFKDASKFYHESEPINRMLLKARTMLVKSELHPLSRVIILTARSNFDNRKKFLDTFRKHNFDIDRVYVERAGELEGNEVPAIKKTIIIRKYLKTDQYNKVRLFDDSMSNLREFLKLQKEFSDITFQAFFAMPDGSVKIIK